MTEKQFKTALLRGQGRCLSAVRENPAKYFNAVLQACESEIAFDPQCEGTRSQYMYEIISCYENSSPFVCAAASALEGAKSDGGWLVLYLAELLGFFAADGNETALNALWDKYRSLYEVLLNTQKPPQGCFNERDDFESLALVLSCGKNVFYKIAEDIGRLYREKPFIDGSDFEWLWQSKGKKRLRGLEARAEKSKNISAYLSASLEEERRCQELKASLKNKTAPARKKREPAAPEEVTALINSAKTVPVCFDDTTGWHGIFLGLIGAAEEGADVPAETLLYIYENNFCSCCRESVLRVMSNKKLLTREILEECALDGNYGIRKFARAKLKKIK